MAWKEMSSGFSSLRIYRLAIDPNNTETIYAQSGSYPFSSRLFKTVNGGKTWKEINSAPTSDVCLVHDPKDSGIVFLGGYGKIWKSPDGGSNWKQFEVDMGVSSIGALAIDPQNTQTLYAGGEYGGGVFKSTDGGASWNLASAGLRAVVIDALAIDPQTSQILYAGTSLEGVFKSVNGGKTWKAINSLLRTSISGLAIDPQNPRIVYAGEKYYEGGVYKSTDRGETWNRVYSSQDSGVTCLAIDPQDTQTLYAGDSGAGMFKSNNRGKTWQKLNLDLQYGSFTCLAIDPKTPHTLYAGSSGNGVYRSTDGGANWSKIGPEPDLWIYCLAIDPQNPQTLYTAAIGGVFKSIDGGATWSQIDPQTSWSEVTSLAIDPKSTQTLYAGTQECGVFKSTDGGETWNSFNSGFTYTHLYPVNSLAIDPRDPGTIYAGTEYASVFKRKDSMCPTVGTPSSPMPAEGATGVDPSSTVVLSWAPAANASSYDVYSHETSLATYLSKTTYTLPWPTLREGNTYCWRVVARNSCDEVSSGPDWCFTTGCLTPGIPASPSPADGASGLGTSSLNLAWAANSSAANYDLYFGTSPSPPRVSSFQTTTSYNLPLLSAETVYYWKVDARNNCGDINGGPTWSFSTAASGGSVIGTWKLVSINGQPANPADPLTYVITATTATSQTKDCTEEGTYSLIGNVFTVTITSVSGSCGDSVGDQFSHTITIDGDTLTIVTDDEELGPATHVFTRVK